MRVLHGNGEVVPDACLVTGLHLSDTGDVVAGGVALVGVGDEPWVLALEIVFSGAIPRQPSGAGLIELRARVGVAIGRGVGVRRHRIRVGRHHAGIGVGTAGRGLTVVVVSVTTAATDDGRHGDEAENGDREKDQLQVVRRDLHRNPSFLFFRLPPTA